MAQQAQQQRQGGPRYNLETTLSDLAAAVTHSLQLTQANRAEQVQINAQLAQATTQLTHLTTQDTDTNATVSGSRSPASHNRLRPLPQHLIFDSKDSTVSWTDHLERLQGVKIL